MNKNCFIFPHFAKCGGSSLRNQLENSNLNVYFDYEFPMHPSNKWMIEAAKRRNTETGLLNFENFDLVFGHFPISRYQRPEYRYIALMRHPIKRAVSHFFYWKDVLPETNLNAIGKNPIIKEIKNGDVDFITFLKKSNIDNFFKRNLDGKEPKEFELVGFLEDLDSFFQNLSTLFDWPFNSEVHLRKGNENSITSDEYDFALKYLAEEIELFDRFRSYWEGKKIQSI